MIKLFVSKTIICLFLFQFALAQSNKELAFEKGSKAIQIMDNGQVDEAIKLLEEAQKLDPDRFDYPYEIAYAKYLKQDYKGAIKILEKLENHKNVTARLFQLLGNSYDNVGQTEKALKIYESGLQKFPNSGILYLEQGIIGLNSNKYDQAISFFEKGIQVEPSFSSNYFWAAKIYCNSTEKLWGMIYGELFMNIERNSKRTAEISKLLYDTYKNSIEFTTDSTMKVSFTKNMTINASDFKLPFGMIYEPTLLISIAKEKTIDLNSLDRIRDNFIKIYFQKEYNKKYPNVLYDFQKKLIDAGYFECYNHWILMKGDEDGFDNWYQANKEKWENFAKWFKDNGLVLDANNKFFREQY